MMLPRIRVLLLCGCLCALWGADTRPSFEVASVRPAPSSNSPFPSGRYTGGPGTASPRRITWEGIDLMNPLLRAFQLSVDQISGPDWLSKERFTFIANIPPNTDESRFNLMLQRLLEERFHLKFHRVSKKFPAYELIVAKGGPKITLATPETGVPLGPPYQTGLDRNGFPVLPPGVLSLQTKRDHFGFATYRSSLSYFANTLSPSAPAK